MTDTSREAIFKRVLYIQYLVWFCQKINKDKYKNIRALIDLSSVVNAMNPAYTTKLGFYARKIDIGT